MIGRGDKENGWNDGLAEWNTKKKKKRSNLSKNYARQNTGGK